MTATTEEIWHSFRSRLFSYIRARSRSTADAEDILQEVFVKVERHLDTLDDDARLTSWLYRVTHNAIVDYYRKRRAVPMADPPDVVVDYDETGPTPEQLLAPFLADLIDDLPAAYQEALRLTDLGGLTQKEMGLRLGLSPSGAKSRVQRGRVMLRDQLLACCRVETDSRGHVMEFSAHPEGGLPADCPCNRTNN